MFNMDAVIFAVFLAGMPVKRKIAWICVIALAVVIKALSYFPAAVEKVYATGIYPVIASTQRILLGWIPFSVGDILYTFAILWLLYGLVSIIRRVAKKKLDRPWLFSWMRRALFTILVVYVLFNGLWGLNYDRLGIASQLELEVKPYSTDELGQLLVGMAARLNEMDSAGRVNRSQLEHSRYVFEEAHRSYSRLEENDYRFGYRFPSIKSSLFGALDNYMGFGGYYNPFTGEAQVNTNVPVFTQPFTTCHEMGHQLGYAKEDEANFAGYLAARRSDNKAFRYSVYFDLYIYAARELYLRDSTLVRPVRERLKPDIRQDYRDLQNFNRKYINPFEPVLRRMYGGYLRANRQPQGIKTYDEVNACLIAYANKYGWESL